MKVLIYKRTHKGDPDKNGIFGINDCMGRIRNWDYDAVIGIGGKTPWIRDKDIKQKINWVGLEPKKFKSTQKRGDEVVFFHFKLEEEKGEDLNENYPNLFKYMFEGGKRVDMSSDLPVDVFNEVERILNDAKNSPPSEAYFIGNMQNLETAELENFVKCKGCFGGKTIEIAVEEHRDC